MAVEHPVENAGGEWTRMDNRTEVSEPSNANGLISLSGRFNRGKEREEDIEGQEKKRVTEHETRVNVGPAFSHGGELHKIKGCRTDTVVDFSLLDY